MARNIGRAGIQLLAITTVKTLLQLVAPANQDIVIREVGISFDGTNVTATPIDVAVLFETSAGTATALTPTKVDERTPTALQSTAQDNFSAEPSLGGEILRWYVHPQTGLVWQATPYQNEIIVKGGDRVGLKIATTPSASIDANIYFIFEE